MSASEHLRQVKRRLWLNLVSTYKGWWQWHKIIKGIGIEENTAVILMPDCNREINYLALLYLESMLKAHEYKNAVILTHDPAVKKCAALFSDNILRVVDFSRQKAEFLMQFYCLYEFDKRFVVASLDEPYGRSGSELIGKKGVTAEEIFVIGVYQVYPFIRPADPQYIGKDPDIKRFLEGRPK